MLILSAFLCGANTSSHPITPTLVRVPRTVYEQPSRPCHIECREYEYKKCEDTIETLCRAKRSSCYDTKCETVYNTAYDTVYEEKNGQQVPRQVPRQVPIQKCRQVPCACAPYPHLSLKPVYKNNTECMQEVVKQVARDAFRTECHEVEEEKCEEIYHDRFETRYEEKCETVYENNRGPPKEKCVQVPYQVGINEPPEKVCRKIQVPRCEQVQVDLPGAIVSECVWPTVRNVRDDDRC